MSEPTSRPNPAGAASPAASAAAPAPLKTLHYKRATFVTQLPVDYVYSPSHAWAARVEGDLWRVGLTKFATRMLGEMVDHGFELEPGARVAPGQVVGWVEGFKAISDLFCIVDGTFVGRNAALQTTIRLISKEPYTGGWLYEVRGQPDPRCMAVEPYRDLLDKTIDRILAQQKAAEAEGGGEGPEGGRGPGLA